MSDIYPVPGVEAHHGTTEKLTVDKSYTYNNMFWT